MPKKGSRRSPAVALGAPPAKRSRQQEEGRAAGGAAAAMQEIVAEAVQIKKEKLDAQLSHAILGKATEVSSLPATPPL